MKRNLDQFIMALNLVPVQAATHLEARGWLGSPQTGTDEDFDRISVAEALRLGSNGTHAWLSGTSDTPSESSSRWTERLWNELLKSSGWYRNGQLPQGTEQAVAALRAWSLSEADLTQTFGPDADFVLSLVERYHQGNAFFGPADPFAAEAARAKFSLTVNYGAEMYPWLPELLSQAWKDSELPDIGHFCVSEQNRFGDTELTIALVGALYARAHRTELSEEKFTVLMLPVSDHTFDEPTAFGLPNEAPVEFLIDECFSKTLLENPDHVLAQEVRKMRANFLDHSHRDTLESRGLIEKVVTPPRTMAYASPTPTKSPAPEPRININGD